MSRYPRKPQVITDAQGNNTLLLGRGRTAALPDLGQVIPPGRPITNEYRNRTVSGTPYAGGVATHQLRQHVPLGGMLVDAALVYSNDNTASAITVNAHAFAGSSTFDSFNPTETWVVGATDVSVPAPESTGKLVMVETASKRIYLPPDESDPEWTTLFARAKHTNGRISGDNFAWAYSTVVGKHKSRLDYHTLTNINDTMPGTPTGVDVGIRSFDLVLRPVNALSAMTCVFIGDSRTSGQGSTSNYYGWAARAIEAIATEFSGLIGYENWGLAGTTTPDFLNRFESIMRYRTADLIYYQPSSTNDATAWTAASIDQLIITLANVAAECRRRGIAFVTSTQYPSVAANTPEKLQQWQRMNDHVRDNYAGQFIDFERSALSDWSTAYPSLAAAYRFDSQHCNDAGHAIGAQLAMLPIKRLLGLAA